MPSIAVTQLAFPFPGRHPCTKEDVSLFLGFPVSYSLPSEGSPLRPFGCSLPRPEVWTLSLNWLSSSTHAFTFYSLPTILPPHWLLVPATVLTQIKSSPSSVSNLNLKVNPIVFLAYSLRVWFLATGWCLSLRQGSMRCGRGRKD